MKKILTLFFVFSISLNFALTQSFNSERFEKTRVDENLEIPTFIKFKQGKEISEKDILNFLSRQFQIKSEFGFEIVSSSGNSANEMVTRYIQTYKTYPVHFAQLVVVSENGLVKSVSGKYVNTIEGNFVKNISEENALQIALNKIGAERYKWQMPEEEALLKKTQGDANASYFPKAELIIFPENYNELTADQVLCYKFEIYADKPLSKKEVFIDAETGKIIFEMDKIHIADAVASANTKYSGVQEIITDSYQGQYRLREAGRGGGIETYDMNEGTNYGSATDFFDADNYWNNFNSQIDEAATDAHWGAEMTYDFYFQNFNRNSIDNNGLKLLSYVHYNQSYDNAFWDGIRMTYGDGSNGNPFCALDIVAHEITHGLTSYTANLDYAYESGALNEGFSDIFGCCVEWYAKPGMANWLMGEDIGFALRSISNPNFYGLPDTYLGNFWHTDPSDNGGVHINMGVMSYWFYLVANGGSGTNDFGDNYNVTGISIDSAAAITYRLLTTYLVNTSQFADARFLSIQAAIDLFGPCTPQVEAVTRAWYAVGIGPDYVNGVLSDFEAPLNAFCAPPANVQFFNNSVNGMSFIWDFGDGNTSSDINPVHTYSNMGVYNVQLIADGGACGSDTLLESSYVSIDPANTCITILNPAASNATQTSCYGKLFDSGGLSNYQDNTNTSITIAPINAANVVLDFISFNFEEDYDFLIIYDGPDASSPLIGEFSGTNLPNGGTIISSGNSITLVQTSDVYVNASGFEIDWSCNQINTAPMADFNTASINSCTGEISFLDVSNNFPDTWFWDFGDGTSSNMQNPQHQYFQSGEYTVKLIASNSFGEDSVIKQNFVEVQLLPAPNINALDVCEGESVQLNISSSENIYWYNDFLSLNPIDSGLNYQTPVLQAGDSFYIQEIQDNPLQYTGKADNSGGGNNFSAAATHYLVFDCISPLVLKSVLVYAQGTDDRTITLSDALGNVIEEATIAIPDGQSRVELNFNIPVGNNLRLGCSASPNLFRNNGGTNYPYEIQNLISINYSSASSNPTGYYYFFYDWEVQEPNCRSNRINTGLSVHEFANADFSYSVDLNVVSFQNLSTNANEYLWFFGDSSSSIDLSPVHIYDELGIYEVQLYANTVYNCNDTATKQIQILSSGIINSDNSEFKIFPNPASDFVFIDFEGNLESIEIYNVFGEKVDFQIVNSDLKKIKIRNLNSGVYFMKILSESKILKSQFVKVE